MRETAVAVWALLCIALVAVWFWMIIQMGPDQSCPNYGEVPALIDGEYKCIPWEVQP
jgi:hypothetical protein